MGLFDGKKRRLEAETFVANTFSHHPLMELFFQKIKTEWAGKTWFHEVQGYYDSRYRLIEVREDGLYIYNCGGKELYPDYPDYIDSVGFRFTDFEYKPLDRYIHTDSETVLNNSELMKIFALEIKKRIEKEYPECTTSRVNVFESDDRTFQVFYFTYMLPPLKWKAWF